MIIIILGLIVAIAFAWYGNANYPVAVDDVGKTVNSLFWSAPRIYYCFFPALAWLVLFILATTFEDPLDRLGSSTKQLLRKYLQKYLAE